MSLKLTKYEQINLIHSVHLPFKIGVAVTIEPLEEVEEPNGKCVLLIKGHGVLNPLFI